MKLLSKKQAQSELKKQNDSIVYRGIQTAKEVDKFSKRLNNLKTEYERRKTEAQESFDKLVMELAKERDELLKEVEALEKRREKAMTPVNQLLEEAEAIKKQLKHDQVELDKAIREWNEKIMVGQAELTARMENVADMKDDIESREENVKLKEDSFNRRETHIKDMEKLMISQTQQFQKLAKEKSDDMDKRQRELERAEAQLKAENENLDKKRKDIQKEETKKKDRQIRLKLAFDEARSKNLL